MTQRCQGQRWVCALSLNICFYRLTLLVKVKLYPKYPSNSIIFKQLASIGIRLTVNSTETSVFSSGSRWVTPSIPSHPSDSRFLKYDHQEVWVGCPLLPQPNYIVSYCLYDFSYTRQTRSMSWLPLLPQPSYIVSYS